MKLLKGALAALLAMTAGTAAAQETTLSAVVFVPRNTTFGEMFVRFVDHVNQEGKGLVKIDLRGGPDAIPTFEQGNALAGIGQGANLGELLLGFEFGANIIDLQFRAQMFRRRAAVRRATTYLNLVVPPE